jgi:hypothetical protein
MPSSDMDKNQEQLNSTEEQPDCKPISEADIDAAIEGSFPASDPLPWTLGTTPCPDPENDANSSTESKEE